MKKTMKKTKKLVTLILAIAMVFAMTACGSGNEASEGTTYKVGICNYVDDASLNQIVENIENQLKAVGEAEGVTFDVKVQNCNADQNVMEQIISDFIGDSVDLMVGVATPVAMNMQAATDENQIPVVFAAVSDPLSVGLVDSLEAPGANITGTSDYLDTESIFNLILAQNPDIKKIGLLYDKGQDSSATPIKAAKEFLKSKNIEVVEATGTTVDEVQLAAAALVDKKVEAVFTPTDNTIMTAEYSIYETFNDAKIPHYTGADSFALNGAFLGYGVDYANLGVKTADMIADILINGSKPAETPVLTFDNGTATINTETCEAIGLDYDEVSKLFEPFCTKVQSIKTAESFDELEE